MQGPDVAPFTLGKQNLLLHTLRQLEKNYFVDGQFFRLGLCSHDEGAQQANATVIIVRGTQAGNGGNGIGLEKVTPKPLHSIALQCKVCCLWYEACRCNQHHCAWDSGWLWQGCFLQETALAEVRAGVQQAKRTPLLRQPSACRRLWHNSCATQDAQQACVRGISDCRTETEHGSHSIGGNRFLQTSHKGPFLVCQHLLLP